MIDCDDDHKGVFDVRLCRSGELARVVSENVCLTTGLGLVNNKNPSVGVLHEGDVVLVVCVCKPVSEAFVVSHTGAFGWCRIYCIIPVEPLE